eukprot:SAG31_NODE_1429_length_8390_cov_2.259076_2_plen_100_part_00
MPSRSAAWQISIMRVVDQFSTIAIFGIWKMLAVDRFSSRAYTIALVRLQILPRVLSLFVGSWVLSMVLQALAGISSPGQKTAVMAVVPAEVSSMFVRTN